MAATNSGAPSKEIYTYQGKWPTYALAWSTREDEPFRLGVASFVEEYSNRVEIIRLDDDSGELVPVTSFSHPYPATKVMFTPDKQSDRDLLATTGDYLRLWSLEEQGNGKTKAKLVKLHNNNRNTEFCAPLTSFDWNPVDYNIVATSSIDTTITLWDIETGTALTQLIAHDKEVYDVAFGAGSLGPHVFSSVGADGSIRLFDRRSLKNSTIIYEAKNSTPLLRISWNIMDPNYLATVQMDSPDVAIIDIRVPSVAAATLVGHSSAINSTAWAPHSSCHLVSASDSQPYLNDDSVYIWDIASMSSVSEPILCYTAEAPVNQLKWSKACPEWIAISYADKIQMLHV